MYYFAYGSNIDIERMRKRRVHVLSRQGAQLEGFELAFNKIALGNPKEGYANIIPKKGGVVEGVLYEVEEKDLDKLDEREGVETGHYKRMSITVSLKDGSQINAIAYVAQPENIADGLRPSKEYLNHLLAGKEFLSESYYSLLKNISTIN